MVFIDGSNFYHSLKKNFQTTKIDFEKFCNYLVEKDDLITIFYYTAPLHQKDDPSAYQSQQKFLANLSKVKRLKVSLGRLERRENNHKVEKGVDVKLVVDLMKNAFENKFDKAILLSNDADFVPAIEEVQTLGKKVVNIAFPKTKSFHVNKTCDDTILVTEIKKFMKGKSTQ